jgi:hypothetical protein
VQGTETIQKQRFDIQQIQDIAQVPRQATRERQIQTPREVPPYVPTTPPIIPILGGGTGLSSPSMPGGRGIFGFSEHSPTWTPGQQGMALFTGSFRPQSTGRSVTKVPKGVSTIKIKKVRYKGRK